MADIVICVHNALVDVQRCLASVLQETDARHSIVIVDDGSDPLCHQALLAFTLARPGSVLIRNDEPRGYTKAANQGLRHANADFVVLLNSDTIVTPGWLEGLIECARSDPRIGIVGPLSNAAGYQSIPRRFGNNGAFAVNRLPQGWMPGHLASIVATLATRSFPRVGVINGFCFGITRAVIEAIGYLDEDLFPEAYGEETDYCLRAAEHGFELAVADHVYVYHAKSRSYTTEQRRLLSHRGEQALHQRHGREVVNKAYARSREEPILAAMRDRVQPYLRLMSPPQAADRPTVPGIQHDATTGGADRGVSHEREGQNVARDRMEGKTGR
ncbi:MAG: glycosyltransferase family 2 protein [Hyphomicrobiales bacterium]|nr:glycosyltransferase family 2 protein [Hyphomicrobiales bacterium]